MDSAKLLSFFLGACLLAGCQTGEVKTEAGQAATASQALSAPDLPPEAKAELERLSAEEKERVELAKRAAEERQKAQAGR